MAITKYIAEYLHGKPLTKWIGLIVDAAPTAVYSFIVKNYPREFIYRYQPGYEKVMFNRNNMRDFLLGKMSQFPDDTAKAQYVSIIYNSVPAAAINETAAADYIRLNSFQ